MREVTRAGVLAVLAMVAVVSLSLVASAKHEDNGHGAIVDQHGGSGTGCFLSASVTGLGVGLVTGHVTEVWSPSGNITFVCQGELPDGVTAPAGHSTAGWICNLGSPVPSGITTNTSFKANPGGKWTAKCKFKDAPFPN